MSITTKIKKRISQFFSLVNEYNFSCGFWNFLFEFEARFPPKLLPLFFKKRRQAIQKYLASKYAGIIASFRETNTAADLGEPIPENAIIWICWWDGIEKMPPLVKACYNSVQKHKGARDVRLITRYNYRDFADIPDYIMEKVNAGIITVTHLSDILRSALLYEYGGVWMDATILVTGKIDFSGCRFYTMKMALETSGISTAYSSPAASVTKNTIAWAGFFLAVGSKHHTLFGFMKTVFYAYWKEHNALIQYLLIDYVMKTAYDSFPRIREMFDSVPYNNPNLYKTQENLANGFSGELFASCCEQTTFHKLNWSKKHSEHTPDGGMTLYGYILSEYL